MLWWLPETWLKIFFFSLLASLANCNSSSHEAVREQRDGATLFRKLYIGLRACVQDSETARLNAVSSLPVQASRPDTLPPCGFRGSWQWSWIMYLSVCPNVPRTGHWGSCQLVMGSLQVKMTCGGAAALALSPCPALDRRRNTLSLPMA